MKIHSWFWKVDQVGNEKRQNMIPLTSTFCIVAPAENDSKFDTAFLKLITLLEARRAVIRMHRWRSSGALVAVW